MATGAMKHSAAVGYGIYTLPQLTWKPAGLLFPRPARCSSETSAPASRLAAHQPSRCWGAHRSPAQGASNLVGSSLGQSLQVRNAMRGASDSVLAGLYPKVTPLFRSPGPGSPMACAATAWVSSLTTQVQKVRRPCTLSTQSAQPQTAVLGL